MLIKINICELRFCARAIREEYENQTFLQIYCMVTFLVAEYDTADQFIGYKIKD